jgi:hypothetical protein
MTGFPNSPRLVKGGLVQIDPVSGAVLNVIALQYNPDSLSRTLQVQSAPQSPGDRSQAMRLTGPPIETLKVEAEIDASDRLEHPDAHATTAELGLHPELAALEALLYPRSADVLANDALARGGTLEIIPMEAPLTLFVWSKERVVPVRITEFSVTEEAFDPALNPIRAKVSLGLRVLSINDLGVTTRGGSLFMAYHRAKERLAGRAPGVGLSSLGLTGIP